MSKESYYATQALSQSFLKHVLRGTTPKEDHEMSDSMVIGSVLDDLITTGNLDDYAVINEFPVAGVRTVIDELAKDETKTFNDVVDVARSVGYHSNYKDETLFNKLKDGKKYYNALKSGKILISSQDMSRVEKAANVLFTHQFTSHIFAQDLTYQHELYFKYRDHDCKALVDFALIDDKFIQPYDLKLTENSIFKFRSIARRFRYDIQGAFYTLGYSLLFPKYEVLPFKFVVINPDYNYPLIYTMSERDLDVGRYGDSAAEIKGFEDAIELYEWYEKNGYDYPRDIKLSNGDLELNLF